MLALNGREYSFHYVDEFPFRLTICKVFTIKTDGNKELLFEDKAICSPLDQFNKVKGRKIALTRVLEYLSDKFEMSKYERTLVWSLYFAKSPKSKL